MSKYIFYPGCAMETSARAYNESLMAIHEVLGIELEEIRGWNCCGATEYLGISLVPAYALIGRNLALAARQSDGSRTVVASCSACYLNLAKADHYMTERPVLSEKVNEALGAGGLSYTPGVFLALRGKSNHIITTQVEHPAVINPSRFLENLGAEVTFVPVDRYGSVDPQDIQKAITPRTILITVMHANNEVGTIQPIEEISKIAKERGIVFHTDAAQSVGKIVTKVDHLGIDLLSIAGHKLYAPKGIGELYIRKGHRLNRLSTGRATDQAGGWNRECASHCRTWEGVRGSEEICW